jgi:hypothetical protein
MPTNIYQRTAMAAAIAACFPAGVYAAGVARVDFAAGSVTAVSASGQSRPLSRGSEIEVGETVSTQQGRAQLRFADGAYMSLQPQTEFKVEEFRYSGRQEQSDGIVMNLIKGGMRTITGLIGRSNRNAYRLKTDVATIGIRGTEYSVKYTNSIEVFVADGAISVDNQSGSFTIPGGSGALISNQQTPPQQTDQKPVLPPESPVQEEQRRIEQKPADPIQPIQQSAPPPILTGTFAANFAADFENALGVQVTLDEQGNLLSFADSFEGGTNTRNTNTSQLGGNDGVLAWGRWINGVIGGNGIFSGFDTTNQPLYWVVGVPATAVPASGEATYSMIGSISDCQGDCGNGASLPIGTTLNHIKVDFGTSVVTWMLTIDINGGPLSGRFSGVNQESFGLGSDHRIFTSTQLTGPNGGTGFASGHGFLAGAGASHLGLIFSGFVENTSLEAFASVRGAAGYRK